ncbi:hypothetical protein JQN73_03965 [Glaciimonas sp. PAMC28666]|nr:hypothetical protein JQN73_03965 [Glaciimonas sp. PAMC28666]
MGSGSNFGDSINDQAAFNPAGLLEALIEKLHLKNDAALCRAMQVEPSLISKIRHRGVPLGAALLIRMHEVSGLTVRELRALMGDHRKNFGLSDNNVLSPV